MTYHFIKCKLAGTNHEHKPLATPLVIDIRDSSEKSGAALQTYPQKSADTANQEWEFIRDPGSRYFFIKSNLNTAS